MNLRCLIIDDERPAIELLERFIERTPGLELITSCTKPLDALPLVAQLKPDITFLDIDMPQLTGTALAGMIKGDTRVVFTTSFREFAPEAFDAEAIDYLLKPIAYERFLASVHKARKLHYMTTPLHLFVKTGLKQQTRIVTGEIIYIAAMLNYVEIYSKNERVITHSSMSNILKMLPDAKFSRIHRSYIIGHEHVQHIKEDEVVLTGDKRLTIGKTFRAAFQEKLRSGLL